MADVGAKQASTPGSVEEYFDQLSAPDRAALESLRTLIKSEAPDVSEAIGYGIPGYKYWGFAFTSGTTTPALTLVAEPAAA